jgi:hypothetical protein
VDPDPDPAFLVNPDLNTDTDPDLIRIQGFDDQKLKKKYSRNFFISFFDQKIGIYLMSKLQEKASLQPSKENIQHFQKCTLLTFFYGCG